MAEYQQTRDPVTGGISGAVLRTADQATIPDDPANRDRAEYEAWLDDGNTPDPPDAPSEVVPQPDALAEAQRANIRLDAGVSAAAEAAEQADRVGVVLPASTDPVTQDQLTALQAQVNRIEAAVTAMVQAFAPSAVPLPAPIP